MRGKGRRREQKTGAIPTSALQTTGGGGSPRRNIDPVQLTTGPHGTHFEEGISSYNSDLRRDLYINPSHVYDLKLHNDALGCSSGPPHRPDFGTSGRVVRLRVNRFPIHSIPDALYEYCVEISPKNFLPRYVRRRIYQLAEQTTAWEQAGMVGTVAHDMASRLVSSEPLPQPLEITVHYQEEETPPQNNHRHYTLEIKFVHVHDMGSLIGYVQGRPGFRNLNVAPVISALNLIQLVARGDTMTRRLHFFVAQDPPINLRSGLETRRGFTATLLPARGQLTVKFDVGATVSYIPGNLAVSMDQDFAEPLCVERFVRNVMVETTHIRSQKRVSKLAAQNSDTLVLETSEFGQVSVAEFFSLQYGIQLLSPHLRLVEFFSTVKTQLPPELCTILPNQPFRSVLPRECAEAMMGIARAPPNANGKLIQQLGRQPVCPLLSSSGMNIGSDMIEVHSRVLPKPSVTYSTSIAHVDNHAKWNIGNAEFFIGAHLRCWAVLVVNDSLQGSEFSGVTDPELREAVCAFRDMCNLKGMHITKNPIYTTVQLPPRTAANPVREDAIGVIKARLVQITPKPDVVLFALASGEKLVYEGIKHLCDVYLDLTSMCVVSSKFRASRPQYLSSLALKLNMKLGGTNHTLDSESFAWLNTASTMVVGIDIVRPEPGSLLGTPSSAAVVASVDKYFSQYPTSLSLQPSREELITDLKRMMIERLNLYSNTNDGNLPERVLVYRNGLSEPHFKHLISMEVPRIIEAFELLGTPSEQYRPKLTVIACHKCRGTLFWADSETGDDGNPEAGTVVDRDVISPYHFDFYLQAHGGVAGTARPTLYTVVYDEMRMKADDIQGTTYALSYMYAPATHAVSLPAPAYYASLACKRGRCYVGGRNYSNEFGVKGEDVFEAGRIPAWGLNSTMFYI